MNSKNYDHVRVQLVEKLGEGPFVGALFNMYHHAFSSNLGAERYEINNGLTSEQVALMISDHFGLDARRDSHGSVTFRLEGLRQSVGDELVNRMIKVKRADELEQRKEFAKLQDGSGDVIYRMADYV